MHYFSKSLIVIRRYHNITHRAANHCCQSLTTYDPANPTNSSGTSQYLNFNCHDEPHRQNKVLSEAPFLLKEYKLRENFFFFLQRKCKLVMKEL